MELAIKLLEEAQEELDGKHYEQAGISIAGALQILRLKQKASNPKTAIELIHIGADSIHGN